MRYLTVITILIGLLACGSSETGIGEEQSQTPQYSDAPVSELSWYMRHLEEDAWRWREQVLAGEPASMAMDVTDSLYLATPTEDKIKDKAKFNQMADQFKTMTDFLRMAPPQDYIINFNGVINSCVNCHKSFCPGPIKRIEKLKIAEQ